MPDKEIIRKSLKSIFSGIDKLRQEYPIKKFTIDGRLVGDIGEIIVQRDYDVNLYEKLVAGYDGVTSDGRLVQIKATFKESLTFSSIPDYYLGIKINKDGSYTEIYNGSSENIAERFGHRKGFGKNLLSFPISILKELSDKIPSSEKIPLRKNQNE